jgi:hypothetical protein
MPGRWYIYPKNVSSNYVIAAFVRSPVQIELGTMIEKVKHKLQSSVLVRVKLGDSWVTNLSGAASLRRTQPLNEGGFYIKSKAVSIGVDRCYS